MWPNIECLNIYYLKAVVERIYDWTKMLLFRLLGRHRWDWWLMTHRLSLLAVKNEYMINIKSADHIANTYQVTHATPSIQLCHDNFAVNKIELNIAFHVLASQSCHVMHLCHRQQSIETSSAERTQIDWDTGPMCEDPSSVCQLYRVRN